MYKSDHDTNRNVQLGLFKVMMMMMIMMMMMMNCVYVANMLGGKYTDS